MAKIGHLASTTLPPSGRKRGIMAEAEKTVAKVEPAAADIAKAGKPEPAIVKNASQAYGYNYASLADIAKAGIEIPKMRVKPTEFGDYIEYLDENGEWQLGAKIVIPEMKGSNAAQVYGSALTYARRYTVQLAKGIACDDDKKLERQPPHTDDRQSTTQSRQGRRNKIDFTLLKEVRAEIAKIQTVRALATYQNKLKLDETHWNMLKRDFSKRKEEILASVPEAEEVDNGTD